MSRFGKRLVALGVGTFFLTSIYASAQEPPRGIEEIVVTAERRSASINDVPLTVSAFSGGTMDELGIDGTEDLGRIVPGFVASNSGYSIPVYTLRGVGFVDISYSSTGTVGVYVDEVALPYSIMTKGALLDLERVEVLKGPQGTLYGHNSTGGTINTIANKPTKELDAGLTLGLSRFTTFDGSGFVSGPLLEDVAGRVAVKSTVSGDGWQISQTRPDDRLGEFNKHAGRGLLEWTPREDLLVRVSASGWIDKSHAQAPFAVDFRPQNSVTGAVSLPIFFDNIIVRSGLPADAFDPLLASLGPLGTAEFTGTADPAVAGHPFVPDNDDPRLADWAPDFDWRLNDSYWDTSLRAEWAISETMNATGLLSYGRFESNETGLPQGGVPVLQSDQIVTARLETIGTEIRLDGRWRERVDWLVGFSASFDDTDEFHEAYATKNSFNFGPPVIGNPIGIPLLFEKAAQIAATTGESYGGFTTVHWRITDEWGLTQGFRYTDELRTYDGCTLEPVDSRGVIGLTNVLNGLSLAGGGMGGALKGDCFTLDDESNPRLFEGRLQEDNFSTRTALEWSPTDESLFYLSYTRGYKAGNFPVVIATSHSAFEPATQERLVAYEGGSKTTLLDGLVHVDVAAFFYDYADKQLLTYFTDPVFGALPTLRNAPESSVWGFETSARWNPLEGLDLAVAASWIETRVDEFVGTTARGTELDFAGQPFNYAPKVQASFLGSYGFDVVAGWRLLIGTDVTYADDTNATLEEDPAFEIDAYTLIGARLAIADPSRRWTVTLFGRNLTNELQRTGVFRSGDVVTASAGFPRTYGATLSFRY